MMVMKSLIMGIAIMATSSIAMAQGEITGDNARVKVTVVSGDMTKMKVDAYVVPQFKGGASDGGVGGAIYRTGGEPGMESYDKIAREGALKFGDALVTESGGGNSRYLLNVVSVGSGADVEAETIRNSIKNALVQGDGKGVSTVAAPTLGTGIIGTLTDAQAARSILGGVLDYANSKGISGSVKEFTIVVFGPESVAAKYRNVLLDGSFKAKVAESGAREFDAGRWVREFAAPGRESEFRGEETKTEVPRTRTSRFLEAVKKRLGIDVKGAVRKGSRR